MTKRLIAAVVLASLACWSVPVALASSAQIGSMMAQKSAAQPASSAHDHACCPGIHSRFVPPVFVMPPPADIPCDQHPCCAKQAPQNPPALPAASRTLRPGSDGAPVTVAEHKLGVRIRPLAEGTSNSPFQISFIRSTVLRI
jgi:hypothetical protein